MQNATGGESSGVDALCPTLSRKKAKHMCSIPPKPHFRNWPNYAAPNVVYLRRLPATDPARAFCALTHGLVMKQFKAGTLAPGVVEALLVGAGIEP
jgi:hypothetical protein